MNEASIGVDDLLGMLEQRGNRLPFEIGAFVALESCEALMEAPAALTLADIRVREDGVIHVRRTRAVSAEEAARDVVLVLRRLIDAAGPGVPVRMSQLAHQGPSSGRWELGRVRDEIEAGLIPLNRSASRRVLSRMLRDVKKRNPLEGSRSDLPASRPPSEPGVVRPAPPSSTRIELPPEDVDAALDALVTGQPPVRDERTKPFQKLTESSAPPPPAPTVIGFAPPSPYGSNAPPPGSGAIARPPPVLDDLDAELDALVRDDIARVSSAPPPQLAPVPPLASQTPDDDVDRLLEELPTSTKGAAFGEPERPRSERPKPRSDRPPSARPVRVDPPRDPRAHAEQARSGTRPAAMRPAPINEDATIDESMAHLPEPAKPAPEARVPSPPARERYEATERFQPAVRMSDAPEAARGRSLLLASVFVLLIAGLIGGVAFFRPDVIDRILGRTSVADEEREALAEAEREATRAREAAARRERFGDLVVTSTPDRAQVLMFVGRGPAVAHDLPKGVAHEFVVIADGRAPSRAVVAPDATWESTPEGFRYELAMQTGDAAVAFADLDLGPTRLPANVGTPGADMGSVRIITSPPGAKVYQLIGFTPDVRVSNTDTAEAIELIVFAPGHVPERVFVGPSDWTEREGRKVAEVNVTLDPRPEPAEEERRR